MLRSQGAQLALLYAPFEASRKEEVLRATYGDDRKGIATYECDITSETSVSDAFAKIGSSISKDAFPSILVNAAGYVSVAPLEESSADEAMKTLTANLLGPYIVSNAFAKLFWTHSEQSKDVGQPGGRIISISSQAAHVALNGHGAYCASKAGLNALTRCMANEWGGRGITSNTVSPTVALTALGKKAWGEGKVRDDMLAQIPVGRFSEPHEIAEAILFLCTQSGMINGADLRIDGGFTIR